jgi:hypothetical protein
MKKQCCKVLSKLMVFHSISANEQGFVQGWNFIGAVQPMHLVEGSNTDEFFVAAQWKQYLLLVAVR